MQFQVTQTLRGKGLDIFRQQFEPNVRILVDVALARPLIAEKFRAAFVRWIQTEGVEPRRAFLRVEFGEGRVFRAFGGGKAFVVEPTDGVVADRWSDCLNGGSKPDTGIKLIVTVALGVVENLPHPFRKIGAAEVIVQVASFRQCIEEAIEFFGAGRSANGIVTIGKPGPRCHDGGGDGQNRKQASNSHENQKRRGGLLGK